MIHTGNEKHLFSVPSPRGAVFRWQTTAGNDPNCSISSVQVSANETNTLFGMNTPVNHIQQQSNSLQFGYSNW